MKRKQIKKAIIVTINEEFNKARGLGSGWVRPHWTVRGSVRGFFRKKGIHKKIIPSPWRWYRRWAKTPDAPSPEGG